MRDLDSIITEVNENPHRRISPSEYPEIHDFMHSHASTGAKQRRQLERHWPADASRILELGCGTGPLLARIDDEYDHVMGVDVNEDALALASENTSNAELRCVDFLEWSGPDDGTDFDVVVMASVLQYLTEEDSVRTLAENAYEYLDDGGAFVAFFPPLCDAVPNASESERTVVSEAYRVEQHAITALTSDRGHYTSTSLFVLVDRREDRTARIGTQLEGRFYRPSFLERTFDAAGFGHVRHVDANGRDVVYASR